MACSRVTEACLLLGVDVNAVTLYHTAEELLESQLRVSPLTRETFRLECVAPDGQIAVIETRLFDPAVSRRRNLDRLVPELKQRGAWREATVGRLSVVLISARQVHRGSGGASQSRYLLL